ncbi:hypothetical protein [Yimella sp. RIT 621]|uniref:hypothetical protein n=1 Tax=Yimella sp. RIT 621 TaxID=2510323 RepID=UPI00197AAA83|nr:hypothetical protein [Yimella sp. RIT 621]
MSWLRSPLRTSKRMTTLTVYLAWTSEDLADLADLEGPWHEAMLIAPGLIAVNSTESLSAVYHAIKWSLRREASLIVVPVHQMPKSRGMAAGTTTWLRERTARHPTASEHA